MRNWISFLTCASLAMAAVDGVVTNETTGKPQPGVAVSLIQLGQGMNNVGTVKTSADGKFNFAVDLQPGTPYLLQAIHQGVNYNRIMPPGTPGSGITVAVYEASSKVAEAMVTQDMFLLEPTGSEMLVSERLVFTNTGKQTYADEKGTLRFYVPDGLARPVQVRVQGPQGMPINRPAEKGDQPNVYVIKYPIKPGETNIDIVYGMPMSGNEVKFAGKILHPGGPVRFVAPSGVKLEGPFTESGAIPGTEATAYTLNAKEFAVKVTGTGTLRASTPAEPAAGEASDEGSTIDVRKPLIYDQLTYVLIFSFAMLAVGFTILFRRSVPVRAGGKR